MDLVEIDVIGAEPVQARLERAGYARRRRTAGQAELGGDLDLRPARAQGPADEVLGLAVAVGLGGIEEGDAGIDGRIDHRRGAPRIQAPAEIVASDPDRRDLETADVGPVPGSFAA